MDYETLGHVEHFTYCQKQLELPQIDFVPKLSELLVMITTLSNAHGDNLSMTQVYGRDDAIEYELQPATSRMVLSEFLHDFLGLSSTFSFQGKGSTHVIIGLKDDDIDNPNHFDYSKGSGSKIFVCSDIIDGNYHGGSPLPYLAVIDRKTVKKSRDCVSARENSI